MISVNGVFNQKIIRRKEEKKEKRVTPLHPSLKLGVSLSVCVRGNYQCYAQFDSKADRVTQMGTNSD